jgi:LysM repeat protein
MASGIRAVAKMMIFPCLPALDGKLIPNGAPFIAPYNPNSLSFGVGWQLAQKYKAGGDPAENEFLHTENKTLNVEFFLDGTGASPPLGIPTGAAFGALGSAMAGSSGSSVAAINAEAAARAVVSSVSVTAWINYFFGIVANTKSAGAVSKKFSLNMATINTESHAPAPLKIVWGAGLMFNCNLQEASVSYKLFNQLGQPLRATISATFIEIGKKAKKASPDLTKIYVVKAGDTIYNVAKKEYDDESFYIRIAEANNLTNYRRLVPGQELILPPIAKVEEE